MIGRTLNHYTIVAELGKGGMGQVYLAEDARLHRKVALKLLPPEMAADPERRGRFEREARMVAALNHPNIVTIYSVEDCDGLSFITMEHVEGKLLTDSIPRDGLPLRRFLEIAIPLADAIAAAHRKGITHRDLKPDNVMITGDDRVKVLDFGLAKLTEIEPAPDGRDATATVAATAAGKIVGTVTYMSPEQAEGKTVDARSDVFSLGIVLYEMATGRRPFEGESALSTIASILRDTPREIGEVRPALPRHLGRIVQHCMAKDPDRRIQTALDIRNELEGLKVEIETGKLDVPAIPSPPASRPRRRTALVVGLAASVLVVALAGALLWTRLHAPTATAPPAARAELKSIAVLPFINMSGDPSNDYFSDGLAEELLNVLVKLQGLHVAARTSSFHFKGYTGDVAEIGRQLKVATILEGSVRRTGDRVRITAQLINAADGFHLWSETYARNLDDIFAIQEDIATRVAQALKVTLLGEDAVRLARRPTENLEAYDDYLLGQQRMARRRSDSLTEARDYFQKAIDLDPRFSLAYVALADANLRLLEYGTLNLDDALVRAERLVGKALELDGQLGEAYATLGSVHAWRKNVPEAEKAFRRAIELNPSYAMAHMWYANLLGGRDPERQMELLRKALDFDPLSPVVNTNMGLLLAERNRPEEALERFRRAIEIDPGFAAAFRGTADLYADRLDDPAEAVSWYEKAIGVDPGNPDLREGLAAAYRSLGRFDDAVAVWRKVIDADPAAAQSFRVAYGVAGVYRYVGRFDEARMVWVRAMESDPKAPWPHEHLALHDASLGRLDEAVRSCKEALKRGGDPSVHRLLTRLYLLLDDEASARRSWDRYMELEPDNPFAGSFDWAVHLRHSEIAKSEEAVRRGIDPNPRDLLDKLWFYDMHAGRYAEAASRYESRFPQLFGGKDATIDPKNLTAALNVAASLSKTGDGARAARLLQGCEKFLAAQPPGVLEANYRLELVFLRALQGRKEDALAAFRRAVDQHWRDDWRWLALDPRLESMAGDPRFQTMIAEVRADVARQRQRLAAEGLATLGGT